MSNLDFIILGAVLGVLVPLVIIHFLVKRDERRAAKQHQDRLINKLQLDMASANTRIRKNTSLIDRLIKNYQRLEEDYERLNQTITDKTQAD